MCSLQRPLDDKGQLRVLVEAQAILGVLALCESGKVDLIASDALVFESDANPDAVRRDFAIQVLAKASHFVKTDDELKARAQRSSPPASNRWTHCTWHLPSRQMRIFSAPVTIGS